MNELGYCDRGTQRDNPIATCGGGLEVAGRVIRCSECGQEFPDHPQARAWAAIPKETPRVFDVQPQDYPATVPDRVLLLEKREKLLLERLSAIEARLHAIESKPKPGRPRKDQSADEVESLATVEG